VSAAAERVAAIILAAGEARRFGSQKLLATLRGRPLLQHVLDAANRSSLAPIVLVLGADADEIAARVRPGRALVVRNAEYASGQASSLRTGLRAVADTDAAIVLLGDQPMVTGALLDALAARQRETQAAAVVCAQGARRSPPALLHHDLWPEVDALSGDVGARELLARRGDVVVFDVPEGLGDLSDVDTQEDRDRLSARA
jgi:molybdenum cofactor cytidylyltransferase